jgi:hypothetical protein
MPHLNTGKPPGHSKRRLGGAVGPLRRDRTWYIGSMRKLRAIKGLQVVVVLSTVACAHGAARTAESPVNQAEPTHLSNRSEEYLPDVAEAEALDVAEAPAAPIPPRRSISLGESFVPPRWLFTYGAATRPLPMMMPGMAPSVVINNYYQGPAAASGYGGMVSPYYYPSTYYQAPSTWRSSGSSFGSGTATPNATPHLGGDWPSVPSYGPKMTSQTGPGAVWPR